MLYVVTGQPRHGKTQYVMKMLFDFINDNKKREKEGKKAREIYCDIAGINAEGTKTKLPTVKNQWDVFGDTPLWFGEHDDPLKPDDYIAPSPGAIFIFDECHKVDWVKDSSGALSKHPTTMSMNEHGHEDFIIILITQFPQYIHTHLRGLVEYHFHAKRFSGLTATTIYKWNEFKSTPRAKASIADIYEKEKFKFHKKYYNAYKSASAHDSMKFKMPKEWTMAILLVLFFAGAGLWRFYYSPLKEKVIASDSPQVQDVTTDPFDSDSQEVNNESLEQKIVTLEAEVEALRAKYLPEHIVEMTKTVDITPAMIIASDKTCLATNKYGEKLNISNELCYMMSEDSTMIPRRRDTEQAGDVHNNSQTAAQSTGSVSDGNHGTTYTPVQSVNIKNPES